MYAMQYAYSTTSAESITSGTPYPISYFNLFSNLSFSNKAFSISIIQTTEPKTYQEA